MAQTDTRIPRFLTATLLAIPMECDVHGAREIWVQFNPPANNATVQVPDVNRMRCVDCWEESIPARVRQIGGVVPTKQG